MEIEKYSPKWLLEKINASKTDAHKLMHIIEYRREIVDSTEKQCAINSVSQHRELLKSFADWLQGEVWDDKYDDFSDYVEDYIKTL